MASEKMMIDILKDEEEQVKKAPGVATSVAPALAIIPKINILNKLKKKK